jgi:hypothetical protein
VVEILVSHVRPSALLSGKVLGPGILAIAQMLIFVLGLVIGLLLVEDVSIPGSVWATVPLSVVTFLLGFGFYATAFAAVGSMVSRQEDATGTRCPSCSCSSRGTSSQLPASPTPAILRSPSARSCPSRRPPCCRSAPRPSILRHGKLACHWRSLLRRSSTRCESPDGSTATHYCEPAPESRGPKPGRTDTIHRCKSDLRGPIRSQQGRSGRPSIAPRSQTDRDGAQRCPSSGSTAQSSTTQTSVSTR